MNESIFEGNLFGNGSIAGTPADEDVEEFIDIPEADDESSSEGDTPGGNILELLSRMRGLMPNSDGDEDMDDNDMDSDDYHNKAVDRARRGRNREATDICMEGLKKFPLNNDMKSFRAVIETSVGSVFYSWIFGFGGRVAIKSPEDIKAEYAEMVRTAAEALSE